MEVFKRYRDYLQSLKEKDGFYEVNGDFRSVLSIEFTNGMRTAVKSADEGNLYARAGRGTVSGSALSQCTSEDPHQLLETALLMCTETTEPILLNRSAEHCDVEEIQCLCSVAELEEQLGSIDSQLPYEDKILTLQEFVETRWICNHHGLAKQFSRKRRELDVEYQGLHWNLSTSDSNFDLENLKNDMDDCLQNQLPKGNCSSGYYPVVLSNFAFTKFWVTGWQMFSGLIQKNGSSALMGMKGKQIASPLVSLADKPEESDTGYTFPFDCEGCDGKEIQLIKDGMLVGALHNLYTGNSSGNAGRTLGLVKGNDISVVPKNFLFDCGEFSTQALLDKLGNGLYVFDVFDEFHGINIASGEFSFPCRAVRIIDGKKTELLEGLTINGHICDLLKSVCAVGDHRCYMPLLMHKCWQVGAAAVLLSGIQVTGNQ